MVFTMHGRGFCMRWIIRGWTAVARPSRDVGSSADGLDPRLAKNRKLIYKYLATSEQKEDNHTTEPKAIRTRTFATSRT